MVLDVIFCMRINPTQFISTVRAACTAQCHSSPQQCQRHPFLVNIRDGDQWHWLFYITDHVPLNTINILIFDTLLFLSSYMDCRRVGFLSISSSRGGRWCSCYPESVRWCLQWIWLKLGVWTRPWPGHRTGADSAGYLSVTSTGRGWLS